MAANPKVVLVTGCLEGGIGYALCEAYAARGCIVYATARRPESMSNLNHPTIHKLKLDVVEVGQVDEVVKTIVEREGRIDILVNNAGMAVPGPILDTSMEVTKQAFEVHTFAILRLSRAVAPHMAKRKSGTIVTIGSINGLTPLPWHGTYSAAKAATHSIMDSLWMECQPLGIKTTLIAAGYIESRIVANARPLFHVPEDTLYSSYVSKIYEGLNVGRDTWTSVMPTDEFAEKVVRETVGENPPRFMCIGGQSVWYKIFMWLPRVVGLMFLWWRAVGCDSDPNGTEYMCWQESWETAPQEACLMPLGFSCGADITVAFERMATDSKVVLVTGCSEGGIGFALCEAYAAHGCIVYATARRPESMSNLTHPIIRKLKLDVVEDDQVNEVVKSIIEREGKIDILVNNAGMAVPGPLLDISMDNTRLGFEVHTFAVLRLCRAVAPHMAKRKTGTIVTIGSITGLFPNPWHGTYSAAKAATHSIMDSLWMECQPLGIKTTLIAAGHIESRILAKAQPNFRMPENTLYPAFVSKIFEGLTESRETRTFLMPTDEFAEKVAKETVKRNPPRYMCIGGQSVWYTIYLWLPRVLVLTGPPHITLEL